MIDFKVKKIAAGATLPSRKHADDAGIDIYTNETYLLKAGETHVFTTGITVEFPPGYVALMWDRSSLGAKGIHHFAGVIDAGYRGEWKIVLHNASRAPYEITAGDRVAQCILQQVAPATISEVNELVSSARGTGGFGSSGR